MPRHPDQVRLGFRPSNPRALWVKNVGLLIVISLSLSVNIPAFAGVRDWLGHKRSDGKGGQNTRLEEAKKATDPTAVDLPGFFKSEAAPDITGNTLNILKFVESHWLHAKGLMDTVVQGINGKISAKRCADISGKLSTISLQIMKESLKQSATCLNQLSQEQKNLEALLTDLNRIITAPREETMANLEKTISRVQTSNDALYRLAKSNITGAEALISIGGESYQTLELIPTLSISPIDILVQGSKQIMRQLQSNNEAMKGLLLNVQSGCEQTVSNLELMLNTVKTTLRFSDHFAFKQYPLVNLPVPTREKLFSQLGALQNVIKGIDNTLMIGESHVKNSSQQFSHLVDGITTKIKDALQYLTAVDLTSGTLPQISVYALNQINGLYQRTKDGMTEMRISMAKSAREGMAGGPPQVAMENQDEASVRRANSVADTRLPLFLLGTKGTPGKSQTQTQTAMRGVPQGASRSSDNANGLITVLYSDNPPADTLEKGFRPDEMAILQKELGGALPPVTTSRSARDKRQTDLPASTDSLDGASGPIASGRDNGEADLLQSFNPLPSNPSARMSRNDKDAGDSPSGDSLMEKTDLEMLPMEAGNLQDTGDLIPMLRLDEPLGQTEKE